MTTTAEPARIAQAEDDAAVIMADDGRVDGPRPSWPGSWQTGPGRKG
jgi:hypothetical protein